MDPGFACCPFSACLDLIASLDHGLHRLFALRFQPARGIWTDADRLGIAPCGYAAVEGRIMDGLVATEEGAGGRLRHHLIVTLHGLSPHLDARHALGQVLL